MKEYSGTFNKLGYELEQPTVDLVEKVFHDDDPIAVSLVLGYSLTEAIFFNLYDYQKPDVSEKSQRFWDKLKMILTHEQLDAVEETAACFSYGLTYQQLAEKVGIKTEPYHKCKRFRKAWIDSGIAEILQKARNNFFDKSTSEAVKDMY